MGLMVSSFRLAIHPVPTIKSYTFADLSETVVLVLRNKIVQYAPAFYYRLFIVAKQAFRVQRREGERKRDTGNLN